MAMNKTVLGALMQQKVHAIGVSENPTAYFEALADAVIQHLIATAIINTTVVTVVATPNTLVGTGAGTGIGKIS